MATTINKIGVFLFDCLTKPKIDLDVKQRAESIILNVLEMGIKTLDQNSFLISLEVTEMLTIYLSILKKTDINESHMVKIQSMFQIIVKRIGYPSWYSFDQEIEPNSDEEYYNKFRGSLTTLFINMIQIKPIQNNIVSYVFELLNNVKNNVGLNPCEKEVPLYLFYVIGAAVADSELKLISWDKIIADSRWAILDQGMALVLSMTDIFSTIPLVFLGYEIIDRKSVV